jgi:hypothetical protein
MRISDRTRTGGDELPVTGVKGDAPDFLVDHRLPEIAPEADGLLADINVLLAQNPGGFNFRAPDLGGMHQNAKRQLLIDMQEALGIRPLRRLTP